MRLFKKEIKPCGVEVFAGYYRRYVPLEEKWYPEDYKEYLIEKWQKQLPNNADYVDFQERLVELPDTMPIPITEYVEWMRFKQAAYEDLHG